MVLWAVCVKIGWTPGTEVSFWFPGALHQPKTPRLFQPPDPLPGLAAKGRNRNFEMARRGAASHLFGGRPAGPGLRGSRGFRFRGFRGALDGGAGSDMVHGAGAFCGWVRSAQEATAGMSRIRKKSARRVSLRMYLVALTTKLRGLTHFP